ncbi:hypothetical protein ONE63_001729 [Megalurothrips usitatus]|uniref:Peptidase S1 domain-containing protein n=1 Tax=Megalurothrips usitatus TaxID=439358 RepID=A0AAV7X977_9NEOP|nr:hypothetical protein ONE63_001729 [Megalurothrips usitatus]
MHALHCVYLIGAVALLASFGKVRCDDLGYAPSTRFYPWHAYIKNKDHPRDGCGGSLIADNAVLTTATCVGNPQAVIKVALGTITIDETTHWRDTNVSLIHPGFSSSASGQNYNIALIFLSTPITPDPSVRPVVWRNAQQLLGTEGAISRIQTIGFKKTFAAGKPQYRLAFYFMRFDVDRACNKYRTDGFPDAQHSLCLAYTHSGPVPNHLGDTGSAVIAEPGDPRFGNHVMVGLATWHPIESFQNSAFIALRVHKFNDWIQRWLDLYPAINSQQSCSCVCPPCPPRRRCYQRRHL